MKNRPNNRKLPLVHGRRLIKKPDRFAVEHVELEFGNGERRTYERMTGSGKGAVIIVALLPNGDVLLVREYVVGLHAYELGLPKGQLEAGEDVLEAANRELKEEAGYGAAQLQIVGELTLAPSYMSHKSHVVLARDLYAERLAGDEPEELEVVPWSMGKLLDLVQRPDVTEGRTIAALFIVRELLQSGRL